MLKQNFFFELLSGPNGTISSKRTIAISIVALWIFSFLVNLFTGKAPSVLYQEEHYQLVLVCIGTILGERIVDVIEKIKAKKKTTTTTATPEPDPSVTITEKTEPAK